MKAQVLSGDLAPGPQHLLLQQEGQPVRGPQTHLGAATMRCNFPVPILPPPLKAPALESVVKVGQWSEKWARELGALPRASVRKELKRNVPLFPVQKAESRARLKSQMPGPQNHEARTCHPWSPSPTAHLLPLHGTEPTSLHFQVHAPFSKTSPGCSEVLELKLCVIAQGPSQRSTLTALQGTEAR